MFEKFSDELSIRNPLEIASFIVADERNAPAPPLLAIAFFWRSTFFLEFHTGNRTIPARNPFDSSVLLIPEFVLGDKNRD